MNYSLFLSLLLFWATSLQAGILGLQTNDYSNSEGVMIATVKNHLECV